MKRTLRNWLSAESYGKPADLGLFLLRLIPGFLMVYAHGWGKLTAFNEKSGEFYNFMGLGSEFSFALVVLAEFFCSVLVILGLFTRFAVIPLIITMIVIVFDVKAGKPISEFETPFLYMIIFITLLITGAGKYSLDHRIWKKPVQLNM